MNWADLSLVATIFVSAVSAGTMAASAKMGWFSLLFAAGGFALGILFGLAARFLAYALLFTGTKRESAIFAFVSLVAYLLLPMVIMIAGFLVSAALSLWIARHCA